MRFRTLALAVALALGSTAVVSPVFAADKTQKRNMKRIKKMNKQQGKYSKAAKVKPRKAPKAKAKHK